MNYRLRILMLSLMDSFIIANAVMLAYFLRFEFQIPAEILAYFPYVIIGQVIVCLITFNLAKTYRRLWHYASIGELVSLIKTVSYSEFLFFLMHFMIQGSIPEFIVPRSIYILSWAFIIIGVGGSRFAWRIYTDSYKKLKPSKRRTLIVGAGDAGVMIAKELIYYSHTDTQPVAFVDDDPRKWNLEIMGIPILGGRAQIPELVKKHDIQKIIIAIPSAPRSVIADIIEICKETKAVIKILPHLSDLVGMNVSVNMIREVHIEDLLGRDPIKVDLNGIANYVTGQVVLVTGAGGSIGSELCRQIAPFKPSKLLLLGHGENSIYEIAMQLGKTFPELHTETIIADIQDLPRLKEIFNSYHPSVVFHAAAHKHVPLMEQNPSEAVKNNIFGTGNLAECAHLFEVAYFVMISTDKAVNPTSVMGATKRVAEMVIQCYGRISTTKFVAVRFGNVLGSRGSVVPLFKKQIQLGGPVTVTHPNIVRYFMTIPEAVQLVIQAGAFAQGGEIFVLDMGQPVKIADLARDLIRLSGYEPDKDIKIVYTGLRPGEKLYEEILTDEEGITSTKHDRIFIGKPGDYALDELQFQIKKLAKLITKDTTGNRSQEIKNFIKQVVPTYHDSSVQDIVINELQKNRQQVAITIDNE